MRRNEHRPDPARDDRDDAGAVSVFAVIAATILVMFVGVAVDLSGLVHTLERAQDVARQAARAAAEAADAPRAMRGEGPAVDSARAVQAGQLYLSTAGMTGTVQVSADTVTVSASASYSPVILGLVGLGPRSLNGTSTARITRALQGVQQGVQP